jgi:hypothetical protein
VNFDGILPPSWKAELEIVIRAPSAANEAITASNIRAAPLVIAFRIVRPPIEIALNRQTYAYCFDDMAVNGRNIRDQILVRLKVAPASRLQRSSAQTRGSRYLSAQ